MPVVLRQDGFKFFFDWHEGLPRDVGHVHVEKAGKEAMSWTEPQVALAYNDGYDATMLRLAVGVGEVEPGFDQEGLE